MNATQQQVQMAAKLYECRDTAKRLFGDGYKARMDAYGQTIKSMTKTTDMNKARGEVQLCSFSAPDPMEFPRADPAELAKFDPATRWCQMNCGKHRQDPRTFKEIKLLCGDCLEIEP